MGENRDLLLGAAAVGILATVAGVSMADRGRPNPEIEKLGAPHELKLNAVIKINTRKNGIPVEFRTTADMPKAPETDNTIPDNQISLGGGNTAANVDSFYVQTYLLEEGYQPDKSPVSSSHGLWLVFPDKSGKTIKMSLSPKTWGYWKVIAEGKSQSGNLDGNNNFVTDQGDVIPSDNIGEISLENPLGQPATQPIQQTRPQ